MIFANYSKGIKPPISAAVHGAGMCDEPLRMSAWKAKGAHCQDKIIRKQGEKKKYYCSF